MEKDKRWREEGGAVLQSTRGPPPPLDPPNLAPFSFHSAAAAFPPPISISLEFRMEIVFPMAEAPSPPPSLPLLLSAPRSLHA